MKILKKILLLILVLLILVALGVFLFINNQRPNYSEELKLPSIISQADIHYDKYGIPHIYADNYKDAYLALGYAHAKDRLWQIELMRRIMPGRLCEVFGKRSLKTDQFFRSLDQNISSRQAVKTFRAECPQPIQEKVDAYIEGINHFIKNGPTPIEYHLIGLEKTEYNLEDMYNIMGYMSFSFAVAHRSEPILTRILQEYGSEYMNDLNIQIDTSKTIINGYNAEQLNGLSMNVSNILDDLPVPQLVGSNSWVISSKKTTTDGAIFANDPHMRYGSPSVWYEAQLTVGDKSVYGNYVGGFPMPLIGNTNHHAIGLTMFANDDIDFYKEKINPEDSSQYWHIDQWKTIETKEDIIKVKDGEDYKIKLERTIHGPIVSKYTRDMPNDESIAMFWVYEKFPLKMVEACHQIIFSESVEEAAKGAAMVTAPGLNIMYGDIDGNIAWWASAKLPKRNVNANPKFILDGSTGEYDISEYYDFSDNPQSVNPPSGYVYSANNQSVSATGLAPWGYYQNEDRARRIRFLLDKEDQWDIDKTKEMITDITSINDAEITQNLLQYLDLATLESNQIKGAKILKSWDGKHALNSIAPSIYYKWLYHVLAYMMKDEVGENVDRFINLNVIKRSAADLINKPTSIWWDDISTDEKESPQDIVKKAYEKTITELESQLGTDINAWQWSKVHTLEHEHALGANDMLKPYFNVGPFPVEGGRGVINNYNFSYSGDGLYETSSGPSCRRVINLNDIEGDNWSILPTGQSGNRWSPHYRDQAEMYVKGEFRKQLMNQEEIVKQAVNHTVLKPE